MQLEFFTKLWRSWSGPPPPPPKTAKGSHAETEPRPLEAAELLAKSRELLRGLGCGPLADKLAVRWNPRMRSTAGTANWLKGVINLNPRLQEFGAEEIERTLLHELAHLLAQFRAGKRRIAPHGQEWRQACVDLGLRDEKRCHELPLPRRQVARRHHYKCPGCAVEVKRVRPFRGRVACLKCCRKHSGGRYDERFRFARVAS